MIEVEDIHKRYQDNRVLHGLSFEVPKGHITGLVGPNGAGKSTAIRILTGYSDADSGRVRINGLPMSVNAIEAKRLVGYAPESAPSYKEQTVREYLRYIAQLRGVAKGQLDAEVKRVTDAFSLTNVSSQLIGTLSKGYRHRVSLAQCLLADPPVIVLDEPTDGLDPIQKVETRKIILELAQSKAVLLTTHILEEVEMLCSHVVAIRNGKIAFSGEMKDIVQIGVSEAMVYLRVADADQQAVEIAVRELDQLVSIDCQQNGTQVCGQLRFSLRGTESDVLDDVSVRLGQHNLRIVELRRDDPALASVFRGWAEEAKQVKTDSV